MDQMSSLTGIMISCQADSLQFPYKDSYPFLLGEPPEYALRDPAIPLLAGDPRNIRTWICSVLVQFTTRNLMIQEPFRIHPDLTGSDLRCIAMYRRTAP